MIVGFGEFEVYRDAKGFGVEGLGFFCDLWGTRFAVVLCVPGNADVS